MNAKTGSPLDQVFISSDPEKVLENASHKMDENTDRYTGLRSEITYVQLGIINPLANDFIEAAGLGGNSNE